MSKKYVYSFGGGTADGDGKMKDILGGKGANLAEMCNAGVPVPPGFTISTEVCNIYFNNNARFRRKSTTQIRKRSPKLEKRTRQEAGRTEEPAAAQRALRREVLHARHDEHHPEPGPER